MATLSTLARGPAKVVQIGNSGDGKTGAIMSLICAGYKIRMIDTDNGARTLGGLLHDNYPYAAYMRSKGIDWNKNVSIKQISTAMGMRRVSKKLPNGNFSNETLLAPKDAKAWNRIVGALEKWEDEETGENHGHFGDWGDDTVLVMDSFTTISRQAYYLNQEVNGRLGAMEDGYTHQKDVGGAQTQLRRLLEMCYGDDVKCNIIYTCHINRIDDSRGYNQTPEQIKQKDPDAMIEVKGYPQSVGLALSKRVGIYFNDSFVYRQDGSGRNVSRKICTVPTTIDGTNVSAKNSTFLKPEYDISSGLAEIFAALKQQPEPSELIEAIGKKGRTSSTNSTDETKPQGNRPY